MITLYSSSSSAGPSRQLRTAVQTRTMHSTPQSTWSRTCGLSTAMFVLTLCVPYVAATSPLYPAHPLPTNGGNSTPLPQVLGAATSDPSSSFTNLVHSAASAFGRVASKYLITGRGPDGNPPIFALAVTTLQAMEDLPDGMLLLEQHYNAGFIVLSYLIAFVGSLCTLELLIRRTSNRGLSNQLLLTVAGCCFGSVSTFAMHFVGNNSLSLHHPMENTYGYQPLYLSYGAGFTILSLVASCLAMSLAFFVMGTQLRDWWICIPGNRKQRRKKRATKSAGNDYKKWKSSVRKDSKVVSNALWSSLALVSKWSMIDGLSSGDSGWRSTVAAKVAQKAEDTDWDPNEDGIIMDEEDIMVKSDKELRELDFRKGRLAVREEIDRRQGTPSTGSGSLRHMASDVSLISPPTAVYHPQFQSGRRGSMPPLDSSPGNSVFSPNFNFPPKIDSHLSASISPSGPASAPPTSTLPTTWTGEFGDIPAPPLFPNGVGRRASLPAVSHFPVHRAEPAPFKFGTLSRIQSLPEQDPEMGMPRLSVSGEKEVTLNLDPESNLRTVTSRQSQADSVTEYDKADRPVAYRRKLLGRENASALEKFLGFDVVTRGEIIKIIITGFTAGLGVAAMHYIGQLSIIGLPYIAYKVGYVVGSVVIACGAVIIALYIMFIMLRPKLKHDWYLKILVALILAVAVCAMHYTAMRGTIYAWPVGQAPSDTNFSSGTKVAILALVASLAFVACLGVAGFVFFNSRRIREERNRRRRVVVAHVAIDSHGRVLVNSSDGMLPMCDITSLTADKGTDSSMRDSISGSTILGLDLTTHHEAFVSALRMSWSWRNPLWTPANLNSLGGESHTTGSTPSSQTVPSLTDIRRGSMLTVESSAATSNRPVPLSISKFLEKFATSSVQLAVRLTGQQDGISRLGVLYDQILTTGWVQLSNSTDTVSKGQLIFLVRRVVSHSEQSDLLARHFIFADPSAVAVSLHKTLSVPLEHTTPLLQDIQQFCDSTARVSLKSGTLYTGVAVVQATPFDGLRILCEPENRSQLPMRELCTVSSVPGKIDGDELCGTVEELGEAVTWLDGMTLLSIITRNMTTNSQALGGPRVAKLLLALERALIPMLDEILTPEDMAHVLPRLTLHPVLVPLTPGCGASASILRKPLSSAVNTPPYLIVFYANYDAAVNTFTDKWLPFPLFRAQNACVMSQKIQAATRAEYAMMATANYEREGAEVDAVSPGYHYGRRPSKVQFEFPAGQNSSTLASDLVSLASPSPLQGYHNQPPSASNLNAPHSTFGTFSFPAKTPSTSILAGTDQSSTTFPPSPKPLVSSLSKNPKVMEPRQSLFVKPYLNDDHSPSEGSPLTGGNHGTALTGSVLKDHSGNSRSSGVAYWDAEWLLNLLRNKLRADA